VYLDGALLGTNGVDQSGSVANTISPTSLTIGTHSVTASYFMADQTPSGTATQSISVSGPTQSGYSYSITDSNGNSGYTANGNVATYTDSINGQWTLGYDSVNRLTSAATAGQYICWTYDSFGNRTAQTLSSTPCGSSVSTVQYPNNQNPSLGYDASGDVWNDGTNQYLYDAEGRICAVKYPALVGGPPAMIQYLYDAEGRRVAKGTISVWSCDASTFSENEGYMIGPSGEQLTEVDGQGSPLHTNVFADGHLIATYDPQSIHFHLSDWLSTRRVTTDYLGNTESIFYSLPFGEMIPQNQSLGATEHFFTGKERDTESGLDYFGARYYASNMGRWMSPDWSANPEAVPYSKLDNPQSLNLYGYVLNNPLSQADPDGHCCWDATKQWLSEHPRTAQGATGVGKIVVGGGLVATIAGGDVPGSVVGVGLVVSGTISAVASVVSGVTDVTGAATNTNVEGAQKALDSVSNVPALVTTAATGNPQAGAAVGTLADAAQLAAKPQEALKNAATMADAVKTGAGTADLVRSGASAAANAMRPPPPPPPPPPSCSVAGACK
jgi:RHS repeat-associated protein